MNKYKLRNIFIALAIAFTAQEATLTSQPEKDSGAIAYVKRGLPFTHLRSAITTKKPITTPFIKLPTFAQKQFFNMKNASSIAAKEKLWQTVLLKTVSPNRKSQDTYNALESNFPNSYHQTSHQQGLCL